VCVLTRCRIGDHGVSCAQASEIIAAFFGLGDAKVQAAVAMYAKIVDKDAFPALLQTAYRFEEDRADVRRLLGL
jgi:hypothetical protein